MKLLLWAVNQMNNSPCLSVCVCVCVVSSWTELLLPMLIVWLLNALIAVAVVISLFTFGEPVTKPCTSASVTYWRHRNQADVYLRRVRACVLSALSIRVYSALLACECVIVSAGVVWDVIISAEAVVFLMAAVMSTAVVETLQGGGRR